MLCRLYCDLQSGFQSTYDSEAASQWVSHLNSFCVGLKIPTVMNFAVHDRPHEIRMEVAKFLHQFCHSSCMTLHTFIACCGIPILVRFLEADYTNHRYFLEGLRILVKQLSTLVKLLVCHTVTVSHTSDQREGNLRMPEEKETAGALGFNLLWVKQIEGCSHAKYYPIYFYFSMFILLVL